MNTENNTRINTMGIPYYGEITPSYIKTITGRVITLTATILDGNVSPAGSGYPITWSSSNTNIATVVTTATNTNSSSQVTTTLTTIGVGTATIECKYNGVTLGYGSMPLNVYTIGAVILTPSGTSSVSPGNTVSFSAKVATAMDGITGLNYVPMTWSSTNTSGATVSPTSGITDASGNVTTTVTAGTAGQTAHITCLPTSPIPIPPYYAISAVTVVALTGTLSVTTNNASSTFTLTGPATYNGSGTSWSQLNAPVGTYSITFNAISGYTTPTDTSKTLSSGGTASFTGTYVQQVGTLSVTTNNINSSFTISPGSYTGGGTSWSRPNTPTGTYSITFNAISGYTTPTDTSKTLSSGGTASFTGTYVQQVGTLSVTTNNINSSFTISPGSYTGGGTSWSRPNTPTGTYSIVFNAISGYTTPTDTNKTLTSGGTASFTGTYVQQVGTLSVTTNNINSSFTISPGSYTGGGTSWSRPNTPTGTYTIVFNAISGYTTPTDTAKTLTSGGTASFTGTYAQHVGTLYVTTNNASSTFTLTGPATYNGSGTTWSQSNAPTGTYSIVFNAISGYTTPTDTNKTLTNGSSVSFNGTYILQTGNLTVTTNNVSATFTIAGPVTYTGSGTTWSQPNAPIGTYSIVFNAISGYTTPTDTPKTLTSGETSSFSGTYIQQTGMIVVATNNASSTFTITGPATYAGSGTSWSQVNAPIGTYSIVFSAISGYTTATDTSKILTNGESVFFNGTYIQQTGMIVVATNNASSTFTIIGPATYTGSGTSWSQTNVPVGTYSITFGAISGYVTPTGSTQTLTSGGTIIFTVSYIQQTGTLTINTTPINGDISIDGFVNGNGHWSGTVPATGHVVSFGAVSGYATPSSQTVTVYTNQETVVTGTYVQSVTTGTIVVNTGNSGASFTVVGPTTYNGTGASWTQSGAPIGSYTTTFGAISGYTTPAGSTQTLTSGGTIIFTVSYIQQTGTLTINTTPINGDISIDGLVNGNGHWSGTVPATDHVVSFGAVSGYATPSSQTVTVYANQETVVTGTYAILLTGICEWILSKGGWQNVAVFDIMTLVGAYLGQTNLGFTVTSAHIMGCVAYYLDNKPSGNSLTGCTFT
jgi:hypothetical protein